MSCFGKVETIKSKKQNVNKENVFTFYKVFLILEEEILFFVAPLHFRVLDSKNMLNNL